MRKNDSKAVRAYVKEITQNLKCSKFLAMAFKKKFLSEIHDYSDENGQPTYEALVERFGAPEDIASSFIEREDYAQLLKSAKRTAAVWRTIAVFCAALIVVGGIWLAILIKEAGGKVIISDPNPLSAGVAFLARF